MSFIKKKDLLTYYICLKLHAKTFKQDKNLNITLITVITFVTEIYLSLSEVNLIKIFVVNKC